MLSQEVDGRIFGRVLCGRIVIDCRGFCLTVY